MALRYGQGGFSGFPRESAPIVAYSAILAKIQSKQYGNKMKIMTQQDGKYGRLIELARGEPVAVAA